MPTFSAEGQHGAHGLQDAHDDFLAVPAPAVPRVWLGGALAAAAWLSVAAIVKFWPEPEDWPLTHETASLFTGIAVVLLVLAFVQHRLGGVGASLRRAGPWLLVLAVLTLIWEVVTAKLGLLPRPSSRHPRRLSKSLSRTMRGWQKPWRIRCACWPPATCWVRWRAS